MRTGRSLVVITTGVVAAFALAAAAGDAKRTADNAKGERAMGTVTFKGNPVKLAGELPHVGAIAPPFKLTAADLSDVGLGHFAGKTKILNIVISLDTGVCALSAKRFNADVAQLTNAVLINISGDLPFAQKRFCESQALSNIVTLSTMRAPSFGQAYGVAIMSGPLAGLMSRAVLVLDPQNKVIYAEQVSEMTHEPNYAAALRAAQAAQ